MSLAATEAGAAGERGASIRKLSVVLLLVTFTAVAYYRLYYLPAHSARGEASYVLPRLLDVVDTTAAVRSVVARLKGGDRVEVLSHTTNWAQIRLPNGRTGWVEREGLLDAETYDRGEQLLRGLEDASPQAAGHTSGVVNLHLEPSRDSITLAELPQNQAVEIFSRRLVVRSPQSEQAAGQTATSSTIRDAWYLIRGGTRAGWILGRLVDLDVPPGISMYAEGVNLVGWQVLKTVDDGGKQVPEYLVADRIGGENVDFNHIRVFNWWVKHHKYVTAYVESNLKGYFPIRVSQMTDAAYYVKSAPYFRLRLVDDEGHKVQKVYGLFDTIVRPLGTVGDWESGAMPARETAVPGHRGRHRGAKGKS